MPGITDQRFQEMDDHGKKLLCEVEVFCILLNKYKVINDSNFTMYFTDYLKDKLKKKPLRAYFTLKIYDYLRHYSNLQQQFTLLPTELYTIKLPFVFEVVITVQYLHNHILDEKYESRKDNFPRINQNLIVSNVLKELLYTYIDQEVRPLLDKGNVPYEGFKNSIRELFIQVDMGQYLDKEYNHYEAWKHKSQDCNFLESVLFDDVVDSAIGGTLNKIKSKIQDKNSFTESYFRRIYCSNVYFFRCIVEVIFSLSHAESNAHYQKLKVFAIQYGFMLQIINDYADFAYSNNPKEQKLLKTAGKKSTDIFADLYNYNITLPLIFHLQGGFKRKIEAYLERGKKNRRLLSLYPNQIKQEIVDSGAIYECIGISRDLANSAIQQLDQDNPVAAIFSDMCAMAFNNKFYKVFLP
jgi:geranylgeranyl pyrophosphate synthase